MFVKRKILVVDDDAEILRLLKVKLEGTGRFNVVTAAGGEEAVRKVREVSPDVVVCDIDMPDLDGGAVAAAIAGDPATRGIPFLFLSALVSPADAASGEVGGWPMISKRTPFEKLVERIDKSLSEPPARNRS